MTLQERKLGPGALGQQQQALGAVGSAGVLLFGNGETTERTISHLGRLAHALNLAITMVVSWDGIILSSAPAGNSTAFAVSPTAVHMGKVAAVVAVIDRVCSRQIALDGAVSELEKIARMPPSSGLRFSVMAGLGAMALGVIFGVAHLTSLALIGLGGFLGGPLRRGIGRISDNTLVQPFAAALLAGAIGAISVHLGLTSLQRLVAVCPCMVLVPGPHFLNGAIDLVRGRMTLGLARLTFATLIVLAISTGLLLGLTLGGASLPAAAPSRAAPFAADLIAAGVAVAAYGTFFSMSWRLLFVPALIGMAAHGLRWLVVVHTGANPAVGALLACLLVGTLIAPIADRLRLPFAALAFASVVSLIPGVFLFRMAGGLVELVQHAATVDPGLLRAVLADGATALLILVAMTVGLIVPRMMIAWATAR